MAVIMHEPLVLGIDLGFGYVKVAWSEGQLKFPSWVAHFTPTPLSQIIPISVDNVDYVVGELARYEKNLIEISTIDEIVKYSPIFVLGAIQRILGEDFHKKFYHYSYKLALGIAPKFKAYKDKIEEAVKKVLPPNSYCEVYPQGYGAYMDTLIDSPDRVIGKDVLVIDIGFNTVDYVLISSEGVKIKGDTIERLGMTTAVEIFRKAIPSSYSELANYSLSRMLNIFETGKAVVSGREISLLQFRVKAIELYSDTILSRMKDEIGNYLFEIPSVILVGGGAYYVKFNRDVYIPPSPEFANARGFYKSLLMEANNAQK